MFSVQQIWDDEEQHLWAHLPPPLHQQRARKWIGGGEELCSRPDTPHLAGGSGALQVNSVSLYWWWP